jgi:hypothetical protein
MAKFVVFYGSEWKTHRDVRRIAKALLKRGLEPEPKYSTGKFWTD